MRKWRKSESLTQLSLKDGSTPRDALLYNLAANRSRGCTQLAEEWGISPSVLSSIENSSDEDENGGAEGPLQRKPSDKILRKKSLRLEPLLDPVTFFDKVILVTSPQDVYCPVLSGTVVLSSEKDKVRHQPTGYHVCVCVCVCVCVENFSAFPLPLGLIRDRNADERRAQHDGDRLLVSGRPSKSNPAGRFVPGALGCVGVPCGSFSSSDCVCMDSVIRYSLLKQAWIQSWVELLTFSCSNRNRSCGP